MIIWGFTWDMVVVLWGKPQILQGTLLGWVMEKAMLEPVVAWGTILRNPHIPSGKRLHNYGKSPFLMGKSINEPFSIAM